MIYNSISNIPATKEQAIIINVGTRFVTTLALLSTLKYSGMPVLLIDCPLNKNNSSDFNYFEFLMKNEKFDLISLPLKNHGETLDFVFQNINADYVLLVDSDLEILNDNIVPMMKKYINKSNIFGSGFIHGPWWIKETEWEEPRSGFYQERIWMPFTFLDVKKIREALWVNVSFNSRLFYNLIPSNQYISRKLLYRVPFLKRSNFSFFNFLKKTYHDRKPFLVLYDTGADIYQYLRYQKSYFFVGIDVNTEVETDYVHHYSGITRKLLFDDQYHTTSLNDEYLNINNRLLNEYSFNYDEFNDFFQNINFI